MHHFVQLLDFEYRDRQININRIIRIIADYNNSKFFINQLNSNTMLYTFQFLTFHQVLPYLEFLLMKAYLY